MLMLMMFLWFLLLFLWFWKWCSTTSCNCLCCNARHQEQAKTLTWNDFLVVSNVFLIVVVFFGVIRIEQCSNDFLLISECLFAHLYDEIIIRRVASISRRALKIYQSFLCWRPFTLVFAGRDPSSSGTLLGRVRYAPGAS